MKTLELFAYRWTKFTDTTSLVTGHKCEQMSSCLPRQQNIWSFKGKTQFRVNFRAESKAKSQISIFMALRKCFQSNYPALTSLEPFCIDAAGMDIITSYIAIKNYLIQLGNVV